MIAKKNLCYFGDRALIAAPAWVGEMTKQFDGIYS